MRQRVLFPMTVGLLASSGLSLVYFGIVSWAESWSHAVELFWTQRWIVLPIIMGFGIQATLYTVLKEGLHLPSRTTGRSGTVMGAGGATSTVAMVACCVHHATDLLPVLGLTVAATFLTRYQRLFLLAGLATTIAGVLLMLFILVREARRGFRTDVAQKLEAV